MPAVTAAAEEHDVLRTVTVYMGLAFVFIKASMLQEIQTHALGFNAYLLYIVAPPAALGVLLCGGLKRALTARAAYFWTGFAVWMTICVPFSYWRGRSFALARNYYRDDLLVLFVIAGLVVSWRECQILLRYLAIAAIIGVLSSRIFAAEAAGRLELEFGSVSNSNDYAAHLLLLLPFLMLWGQNTKSAVVKFLSVAVIGFGVTVILKTASRGALVAMIVLVFFVLFRGTSRQRLALVCLVPTLALVMVTLLPGSTLRRLRSFSATEADTSAEALESAQSRRYLLNKAIEYAIEFPVFGVGPGQFANYEGTHNKILGTHGSWHDAHNSFVQAFADMGVIGGLLHLAGYLSSFLLVNRTFRKAKARKDCRDIQNTAFAIMLSIIGFTVAIFFLNFTYGFYGPAIAGIAISISRAAEREFATRQEPAPPPPPAWSIRAAAAAVS